MGAEDKKTEAEATLEKAVGELKEEVKTLAEKRDAEARERGAASEKTARELEEKYSKLVERTEELDAKRSEKIESLADEIKAERERLDEIERNGGRPGAGGGERVESPGMQFAKSDALAQMLERGERKSGSVRFDSLVPASRKTLLDTGQMTPQAVREPMVPAVTRELRLRDLMNVVNVSSPSGEYYEETGFNAGDTVSVSGITRSGQVATATVTSTASFGAVGQNVRVTVAGADQSEYNGTFLATIASSTTFTYTVSGSPASPATGTITVYVRQTHGAAAMTAEGAPLPEARLQLELRTWNAKKIGHWLPATREMLDDNPQLASFIDNRLIYGLEYEVETAQLLYGSGTGDNLPGILNNDFIQKYSWSSGETLPVADTKIDAIRRAMTLSLVSNYMPSGLVIHPFDWEDVELAKGTDGHYLTIVTVSEAGLTRFFRVPVVVTASINAGTALVGSFGRAAEVKDYQEAEIFVTDSHSDYFVKDIMAIKATERLGLATYRPESFVEITFDAAPT